jgi:coenzyme F420 biosynthesis associated uncharacterized protein
VSNGVDWKLASTLATRLAGSPTRQSLPDDLDARCERASELVVAYTQLVPVSEPPPPEAVDRLGWIEANLKSFKATLDPVVERAGARLGSTTSPLAIAGTALISAEVGAITGYLSRRVLGQYELALLDPDSQARLLLVAPNLVEAAHHLDAEPGALLDWVAFHEMTHVVQFTAVPWLRERMAGLMSELIASLEVDVDWRQLLRMPRREDLRAVRSALRDGGALSIVAGPQRRALLDTIQATMALIEGHAEHVMDAVGEQVLPDLPSLRDAMQRRRRDRPPLMRLLEKVLGLDLKMAQYEVGKRFCDEVVQREGIERLNDAWSAPELAPTGPELRDPGAWLVRTGRAAA